LSGGAQQAQQSTHLAEDLNPLQFKMKSLSKLAYVHALPYAQTVFDFCSQQHNRLCYFISHSMDYFFWLAMTSHKPVRLTTRLTMNPCFLWWGHYIYPVRSSGQFKNHVNSHAILETI